MHASDRSLEESSGNALRQQPDQYDGGQQQRHLSIHRRGRNVTPWLIAPNRPEALTVPAMTALPPLITVMKALAI